MIIFCLFCVAYLMYYCWVFFNIVICNDRLINEYSHRTLNGSHHKVCDTFQIVSSKA